MTGEPPAEHDRLANLEQRRAALSNDRKALLADRLRRASGRTRVHDPISKRRDPSSAALSFAQQRLWFLDQLVPGNPFYNIPAALPIKAMVNPAALKRSIIEVTKRHEALRTRFEVVDGEPIQRIAPSMDIQFPIFDLRSLDAAQRTHEAERIANEEAVRPFDLSTGPLIRAALIRIADDDHLVLFTLHHIVADGWSMGILFREFATIYESLGRGRSPALPDLDIQYPDFAEWQRARLTGPVLADMLGFWRTKLADLPRTTLPTDRARPAVTSFRGNNHRVRVPDDVAQGVRRMSHTENVTPFMVLLSAFLVVLRRATRADDVVIGAPIAGRNRPQLEPLIGFFVNSLVLRFEFTDGMTGRELLAAVRSTTLDAYAHQDLPFEKLVEELQPDRDLSRNPLTQVTFQLQNAPTATGELPDETDIALDVQPGTSIFDLAFSLWETSAGFIGMMQYSTDLFDEATIADLAHRFELALTALVDDADAAVDSYRLVDADEVDTLLATGNDTRVDLGPETTLHELVREQVVATPTAPAISHDGRHLTFEQLAAAANRVAHELHDRGIGSGTVVALEMGRSPEMIAAMLGVLQTGAAYVPLDPDLPVTRRAIILADSDAVVTLTVDDVDIDVDTDPGPLGLDIPVDDPAYVLYTSGSTGTPKGVVVAHRAIVNHMRWMAARFPLSPSDRVLQRTPLHFDASVWECYLSLVSGAEMVIFDARYDGDSSALVDAICLHRVSVLQVVPTMLGMLVQEQGFTQARDLRRVFCGGEPLTPQLASGFFATCAAELVNLYGPTETTVDATYWVVEPGADGERVPIGLPISNMRAYVLDAERRPVPTGMPGELYLAGAGVAAGYLRRPDLTRERFLADPVGPPPGGQSERAFRTGDLVRRRRDGALEFLGRTDTQVKIRGHRIEPSEIERCLEDHAAVARAVVVKRHDETLGDHLVGYVVQDLSVNAVEDTDRFDDEYVQTWQDVYEEIYRVDDDRADDPTFNVVGWNSSYDDSPIPPGQMAGWLDETIERILHTAPSSVLEVGAGTGLIMSRVAPHVAHYTATDFSEPALRHLRRALRSMSAPVRDRVRVQQLAAHEISAISSASDEGGYDCAVLNSVVQYFPSAEYLTDVLDHVLERLRPGGSVFIGDVRNLATLDAFHLSLLLEHGATADDADLQRRLDERLRDERELVLDPRYFATLAARHPKVTGITIRPKLNPFDNELTRYRYDVTLSTAGDDDDVDGSTGETAQRPEAATTHGTFGREVTDGETLQAWLASHPGPAILTDIPDTRTLDERRVLQGLTASGPSGPFRGDDTAHLGSPGEILAATHRAGRVADLRVSQDRSGAYDLVVAPAGCDDDSVRHLATTIDASTSPRGGLRRFATSPRQRAFARRVGPALREHLEARLPLSMVPPQLVVLDQLPLRPNGKIDHARLPEPERRTSQTNDYVGPTTALEQVLAGTFADVLGVRRVGRNDNFFADLGGHSLIATQLISALRDTLRVDIPLRLVFETPTVAAMAAGLLADADQGARVERAAELIVQLDAMTDDEAAELLHAPAGEHVGAASNSQPDDDREHDRVELIEADDRIGAP